MQLCFATNNAHKIQEISLLVPPTIELKSLAQVGCHEELPETQASIEGNSRQKAEYVWQHYDVNCFADDTGLEVEALDGAPGVHSAYYAGPQRSHADNIDLLLRNLSGQTNRKAHFKTVITLVLEGEVYAFEGIVEGTILRESRGGSGFGYDPVFLPDGYNRTFAEMDIQNKSRISHRGRATEKLVQFLNVQAGFPSNERR